jgi:ring-1,2-phenylacetyl-CoA epoxidase subunit PaaB
MSSSKKAESPAAVEDNAGSGTAPSQAAAASAAREWPLWEVFVRSKAGLDHKHCGSLHAPDPRMAVQMARDVYTRRQEGVSVWVVRSDQIVASDPGDKDMYFDPAEDKVYRHPTFYDLPKSVDHM